MTATPAPKPEESALDKAVKAVNKPPTKKQLWWDRISRRMPRLLERAIYLTWVALTSIVQKITNEHKRRMLEL